jgi:hypothetical protein
MSGFHDKVPHWVGCALLELEHSVPWYERKLLPHLETWRQQEARSESSLFSNYLKQQKMVHFNGKMKFQTVHLSRIENQRTSNPIMEKLRLSRV